MPLRSVVSRNEYILKYPALFFVSFAVLASACAPPNPKDFPLGTFDYSTSQWASCVSGERAGLAGRSNDETHSSGHKFSVRTPDNYDATRQHPLIIVYSPARYHRHRTEHFVGLTTSATRGGFIIAYVDSLRLSEAAINLLSQIPLQVAKKWCVDKTRIYLTGHSDGGTVSNAIAFLPNMPFRPRAVAPSAAGIRANDMNAQQCPVALSVMTLQNSADSLFPGYGRELATWWARCNKCSAQTKSPVIVPRGHCNVYPDCINDVETMVCTSPGVHGAWPDANKDILDFFSRT